jgi:hypothetical protein
MTRQLSLIFLHLYLALLTSQHIYDHLRHMFDLMLHVGETLFQVFVY